MQQKEREQRGTKTRTKQRTENEQKKNNCKSDETGNKKLQSPQKK